MATAAHNLLAEKYKLVKENEKEDILGGLDATADLYAKSEQYVNKILQYTAEFRDEQEKYPVYGRIVNGVYVPNNPEEFEVNRQKNADYYNYIYREVSSLIRKLTKDATSRSNSVMWLLSTIRNTPLRDTDENVAIHKNYTIAFLTELFVCLLTHGKLTQSFYDTKRSLEKEYYGEELNESEKEDILGGLDLAANYIIKAKPYIDTILQYNADYDSVATREYYLDQKKVTKYFRDTIKPKVEKLVHSLTKDPEEQKICIYHILEIIVNASASGKDSINIKYKDYATDFLTVLFGELITYGRLTQNLDELQKRLENKHYGEFPVLDENTEKEDILGGLDAALAQEEKVQSYVDQILNIKKDYLSRPQNAQTKEIYQTAVYHRTSQIVRSLAHDKVCAQLLTDFIVDNIWKGSRYPDKYFNDVLYLAFRYLIQEGDLNEDFYEELKGIRQAYGVH